MADLTSVAGQLHINDKVVSVVGETAVNGGIESGSNANGSYTKFPDGTLMQWGITSGSAVSSGLFVTYPVPFISTDNRVTTTSSTSTTSSLLMPKVSGKTTTGFQVHTLVRVSGDTLTTYGTYSSDWQAIGRWK